MPEIALVWRVSAIEYLSLIITPAATALKRVLLRV